MKRKNPYIWFTIIWALCAASIFIISIVRYIRGDIVWGVLLCCFSVGIAFGTGVLFEKWLEVAEWNKAMRFLEQTHEALDNFIAELEKEKDNRPFKEFDNSSDVPFPEVRGDKNGQQG